MLEAVLIDLDNTMVLYNEDRYLENYFSGLHPYFSDILSSTELLDRMFKTTLALRENRGLSTNRDFFLERFCGASNNGERETVWRRFMAFYDEAFHAIEPKVGVPPGIDAVWRFFDQTKLKLVLASNPIFPRIAQEKRMAWGNVDPGRFHLFTHIENMSFVKPHPEYFRQACRMIGVSPGKCLMVGNDPFADMAASLAGIATYLTTDAVDLGYRTLSVAKDVHAPPERGHKADFTGPFAGVPHAVTALVESTAE